MSSSSMEIMMPWSPRLRRLKVMPLREFPIENFKIRFDRDCLIVPYSLLQILGL